MVLLVLLLSAFLAVSAATALRPGRRGIFAIVAYPVGWAAGELPAQAIVTQAVLLGVLAWWGWPRSEWLSWLVVSISLLVVAENLALVAISFYARRIVRRDLATAPVAVNAGANVLVAGSAIFNRPAPLDAAHALRESAKAGQR